MSEATPSGGEDVLDGLTDAQVEHLDTIWRGLIEHVNQRIWYAETRRSSFATLAGGLLAAGVALLTAILVNDVSYRPAFWALLFLALGAIGNGAFVFTVYAGQTNFDYPFKRQTTTWKWFYRDAIPRTKDVPVPWTAVQRKESRELARQLFDEEWVAFATQQRQLADIRVNATQDLQQLYVLHVNEFYKNKFLTLIRKVMTCGLVVTFAAATAAFFISLATRSDKRQSHPHATTAVTTTRMMKTTSTSRATATVGKSTLPTTTAK